MISIEFCDNHSAVQFEGNSKDGDLYIETIITILCKKIKIRPLCQHIFGIKHIDPKSKTKLGTGLWLSLSRKISELPANSSYQFRIRYLPDSISVLMKLDSNSFAYLFYQVRHDFLSGNLPKHTEQSKDGLGLVVTDIVHHLLLNQDKKFGDFDISTFMPKSLKSYPNKYNVKSTTESLLKKNYETYLSRGPEYIRHQYLQTVEEIGKSGHFEKYSIEVDEGNTTLQVDFYIDPFHAIHPGLYYQATRQTREHICTIEELVSVSVRRQNLNVVVARENGIPCYLSCPSIQVLESLVSCLSGYYRLIKRWTFDLCSEMPGPYLGYLKSNRCHGPVGNEFATRKLATKGRNELGVGLVRASSLEYDTYKLSVVTRADQPPVQWVILHNKDKLHFKDSDEMHDTLLSLLQWAIRSNYRDIGLKILLPPFGPENPDQLLIYGSCQKQDHTSIISGPRVMQMDQFEVKNQSPRKGRFSNVFHVQWSGETREQLAIKVPTLLNQYEKKDYLDTLNDFLSLSNIDCVVKVFGVTLSPLSLVMEFLPLGPLNLYLKKNARNMRTVDLVEASVYLSKALWSLHSRGVLHRNIRCHNVLVAEHTEQQFRVKLGDPGKVEYSPRDIHWLPREHVRHPATALTDHNADTWAFATTLWQIFSLGVEPLADADLSEVTELYAKGFMLYRPQLCPKDLYRVMLSCWHPDPHSRKQPQAIFRDINQIFCYIFGSRRENLYQKIQSTPYPKVNEEKEEEEGDGGAKQNGGRSGGEEEDNSSRDMDENLSVSTQLTSLTLRDGSVNEIKFEQIMDYPLIPQEIAAMPEPDKYPAKETESLTLKDLLVRMMPDEEAEITKPIELSNCSIQVLDRIGKGNYGYVFKGKRTFFSDKRTDYVALKRLRSVVGSTSDFKKEMKIMKNLHHENIIEFHCLAECDRDGSHFQFMVMEYLPLGSLQEYLLANKEDLTLTSDRKLGAFAMDIAKGMDYLESQQIIHRDLASRNVLVASREHVKITDFGLAQKPNQGNYYILQTKRELPIKWYALESILYHKFSHKTDVWSYGVTLWETFTRGLVPDLPNEIEKLIQTLKNGTRLVCKPPCQPYIYTKLIRPCWDEEPAMRPDFTKIMSIISELQDEIW